MKKVFRPFWSYDVQKTEDWLSFMAEEGYHFVKMNRLTRCFIFQENEPKRITYRIGYDKMQEDSLPTSLVNDGWAKVFQGGHWYIMANEKSWDHIKTSSVREGIIKRNRMIMYIFSGLGIYLTASALLHISLLTFSLFFADAPVYTVVDSHLWFLTFVIPTALWLIVIYSVIKIHRTNKRLSRENAEPSELHGNYQGENLTKREEKQLKRSGKMIVKRKFGWMYGPDRLEKWLETMERQGHNLYRVNRFGTTFFFVKGASRKVSYCADFQSMAKEGYFAIHSDAGWKSVFSSKSSLTKWTIWARQYEEGEARPQLYSDKSHFLKHARRIAITYSCMFLPLVAIYIGNIALMVFTVRNSGIEGIYLTNIILFGICILTFGSYSLRTWLYYMRLRKKSA